MSEKTLTYDEYLKALALFTMAHSHYAKAREFELAMLESIGHDDRQYGGRLSDVTLDGPFGNSVKEFDDALAVEGYVVEKSTP